MVILEDFPSPRKLNLDGLILNSKLCLVMKNDDRWVPITKQSLEFRFSQSKLSNPDQREVFQSTILINWGKIKREYRIQEFIYSKTKAQAQMMRSQHWSKHKKGWRHEWQCFEQNIKGKEWFHNEGYLLVLDDWVLRNDVMPGSEQEDWARLMES